jgi:putative Ca2+/H+ antiporter (TMEM165/GDT1 family)
MDLAPLISAFILIALTEIGDKTMIAVITLSSKHSRESVFIGAMLALGTVSAIGVLIGDALFEIISREIIEIAAGALFILAGLLMLLLPEKEERIEKVKYEQMGGLLGSFIFVTLMELGDKTQLSIIALSAESGAGFFVFTGAMAAFALITLIEVFFGGEIGKRVDRKYIKIASGAVFLVFGLIFITQALI